MQGILRVFLQEKVSAAYRIRTNQTMIWIPDQV